VFGPVSAVTTISGSPPLAAMFTVSAPDGELTTEVFVAERAWAVTL
jgi:hypothetical protein